MIGQSFPEPFQYTSVANDGAKHLVYRYKLSGRRVGFIRKIYCNWYNDTYLTFEVDGEPVLGTKIERQVGSIEEPYVVDPPILFLNKVEWYVVNNNTSSLTFEVLSDGEIYKRR